MHIFKHVEMIFLGYWHEFQIKYSRKGKIPLGSHAFSTQWDSLVGIMCICFGHRCFKENDSSSYLSSQIHLNIFNQFYLSAHFSWIKAGILFSYSHNFPTEIIYNSAFKSWKSKESDVESCSTYKIVSWTWLRIQSHPLDMAHLMTFDLAFDKVWVRSHLELWDCMPVKAHLPIFAFQTLVIYLFFCKFYVLSLTDMSYMCIYASSSLILHFTYLNMFFLVLFINSYSVYLYVIVKWVYLKPCSSYWMLCELKPTTLHNMSQGCKKY